MAFFVDENGAYFVTEGGAYFTDEAGAEGGNPEDGDTALPATGLPALGLGLGLGLGF